MWPAWVSNRDLCLLSQTRYRLLYAVRQCVCVCVCEREREREREREKGCIYSHVSGGKFYFEKNHRHFFLGQKLLHVRGKASIPFE